MLSDDIDTKLISCLQGVLINGFKMNLNFMTIGDFNYVLCNLSVASGCVVSVLGEQTQYI